MSFIDSNDTVGSGKFGGAKSVGIAGGGIGGLVILLVAAYFGMDPKIISGTTQLQQSHNSSQNFNSPDIQKDLAHCVRNGKIIGSQVTNTTCKVYVAVSSANTVWGNPHVSVGWSASDAQKYRRHEPTIRIFTQGVNSGCGYASANVGPFYCPADQTAYFDKTFFEHMLHKLGAGTGNLSILYVVEHEIGHHIQNIMGFKARNHRSGAHSDSVKLELQADCFAGFWASQADKGSNPILAPINEQQLHDVLVTAWAIGDDTLESRTGRIEPSTFTHGTSKQRAHWFMTGYEQGYHSCNTWKSHSL